MEEHLKIHALARILLAGSIRNVQVSWVKLNRGLSQLCLQAGANDYGGTLMEENISREAGAEAGEYTSPEDFQSLILEIGRIPAERNTKYSRLKIKLPEEKSLPGEEADSSRVLAAPARLETARNDKVEVVEESA
jgi:2-iminoacetate synthase ThiH